MRYIITLLLIAAAPASAEWVLVSETDDLFIYLDPTTIRRVGDMRRVWLIQDLKQTDSHDGILSRRMLDEFDCKEGRHRILALSTHSGPMAGGNTLGSWSRPPEWRYIPPRSANETLLKIVCDK